MQKVCIKGHRTRGAEVIKELEKRGAYCIKGLSGSLDEFYYFPDSWGQIINSRYIPQGYTLIELPTEEVSKYPKVMWVSDDATNNWYKRVVFMEKCGKFLAWKCAQTIKDAEKETATHTWKYASDTDPNEEINYTIEEATKRLCELEGKKVNIK